MKIAVVGLWHLGCVTAVCLAEAGHEVFAFDPNKEIITQLRQGIPPIFEPGLEALLQNGIHANKLHFSSEAAHIAAADIVWLTFDTPVDDQDVADVTYVTDQMKALFPHLKNGALVLISSQLPVGTTRQLQRSFMQNYSDKQVSFAYSPENLRLGKAIHVFTHSERIVVGLQNETDKPLIQALLDGFTPNIIWMSIESAEMTKHALNAFLATSVVFINELSTICEKVGADAREVERGLKTEDRIGAKAYLRPGAAIAGGTLNRDVNFLIETGKQNHINTPFFSSLLISNQAHKEWSCRRTLDVLVTLKNKTIATLGLTYKSGTDTLRRSAAIETCQWLSEQGAKVVAYDPVIKELPSALSQFIEIKSSIDDLLTGADAVIVTTEYPQFTAITVDQLLAAMKQPVIFDASGFLMKALGCDHRIQYFSVGKQA